MSPAMVYGPIGASLLVVLVAAVVEISLVRRRRKQKTLVADDIDLTTMRFCDVSMSTEKCGTQNDAFEESTAM